MDTGGEGRGARRRRERRESAARREARAAWRRPGVLIFVAAALLALGGWLLVIDEGRRVPVREATIDGLHLRFGGARWILDQMDHGENFQKPSTMMPDMPEWGKQRVTLELAFDNRADAARRYDGSEFTLVPELGDARPPIGAQLGSARIEPGQTLNTAIHFDLDTREPHGKLRVAWQRGEQTVYLPVPEPAEHYHLRPRGGELALPPDARMVAPLGRSERGRELYMATYGCVACHGDPRVPESNNIGPHLAGIGLAAGSRVDGMSGEQYIYRSILEPGADIAPECKGGAPCQEPTAMPEYASLVSLEDVADLLAYLMAEKTAEDSPTADTPSSG